MTIGLPFRLGFFVSRGVLPDSAYSLFILNFCGDGLGDLFLLRRVDEDSTSILWFRASDSDSKAFRGHRYIPGSDRSSKTALTSSPIWSLSVLCSWVVCPVKELHELSIPNRPFLIGQLDSLSVSCRSAADLSVRCEKLSQRVTGAPICADRLHGLEASPPVYPETHFH